MAKKKFQRVIPPDYERDLNNLVNLCFTRAAKLGYNNDVARLAKDAELSTRCVINLKECITRFPQYLTVWRLCKCLRLTQQFRAVEAKHTKRKKARSRANTARG